jgi:TolA-binding protein
VRLYLEVAEQYRKLRAGENALFAAARLEARSNADGKARKLLQKYLDRYPDGRFVDEATQRLANLD